MGKQKHIITSLPIVVLMPHSACNCRCIMCDIWKDNKHLKQLEMEDIRHLLVTFKKLNTRLVLMSGGEAILNPNFFRFCELLRSHDIKVSLLSTGLTLRKHADDIINWVNDVIVSLDGNENVHDTIRNMPGAYGKLKEAVQQIKSLKQDFPISSRTVIHRHNFRHWPEIIECAMEMGLDRVSFLPADVSSQAFNRATPWDEQRQMQILPDITELAELKSIINSIIIKYAEYFESGYFAESAEKLMRIHSYYEACHGLRAYPYKKCNAPWVSAVVEADGTVRPCFFHQPIGNIKENDLDEILNGETGLSFRKSLDMGSNATCQQCVCYLHHKK